MIGIAFTLFYLVLLIVFVFILPLGISYNRFVRQRQLVHNAFANIDTELQRRHDLVPNLVETIKAYAAHERILVEVAQARADAMSARGSSPSAEAQQENVLTGALQSLFAVAENYPDLKAANNFLELQRELSNTEDRIQVARRFYNNNVASYNTRVEQFPSSIIASVFGFSEFEYFDTSNEALDTPTTSF